MKRVISKILIFILVLAAVGLTACSRFVISKPPASAELEKKLNDRFQDFVTVRDYLLNLDHDHAWISAHLDNDLTRFHADFGYHDIQDEEVIQAVKRLNDIGCSEIDKDLENNCVYFELWWSSQDIGCGVLYRIDREKEPQVQFMTELKETGHEAWYTYMTDYNEWRK